MDINDTTPWIIAENVRSESTDDGLLLLDYCRDVYFDMDRYAACVWLAIEWTPEGITVGEIVELLKQAVDLRRHRLEVEACRCVSELFEHGFIRPCEPRYSQTLQRVVWN